MAWDGDEWRLPDVPRHVMSPQHTASLNEAVARTAMSEFYGGARQVVEELMPDESSWLPHPHAPEPTLLTKSQAWLREHEMDFFKLIGLISVPPRDGVTRLNVR